MKYFSSLVSVLIILGVIYWSFSDMKPTILSKKTTSATTFSIDNALHHLKNISKEAHFVGSKSHKSVQQYIVNELQKMGLETEIQTQTAVNKKWLAATTTENILARIKGTENKKALLLLTHYDSNPHSSLGASDAGSGVVTILEGIRVFLANNKQNKNDIIILISDAEELGLLGAKAFIDAHDWAKDVGLVLNFEARGSGGPSYMLMETNGKNSKLVSEFLAAKPNFPAANSLMYSIYKKLPNDTDLTVFREEANINGFNFAFIGDHFDYHTAQDSYERLDRETLLHQADYFTSTVNYFANADLTNLNSDEDFVYVNFPFVGLLTYPFSWVLPMLILCFVTFILLISIGFSKKKLSLAGVLKGLGIFLASLVLCGGISFGLWKLILVIHPEYLDMLHGFTYNGYQYILAFVFLNVWILFKTYSYIGKHNNVRDLLVGPLFIWLIINILITFYLKGAAFFIIPVICALLVLAVSIFMNLDVKSKRILCTILSIPTLYIFAPLVKMFPVGLGLKILFVSAIFIALIFGLMLFTFYQKKSFWMQKSVAVLAVIFFGMATYSSGFSIDKKKPNSIVYIENSDDKTAYFGTYNHVLDKYTNQIFDDNAIKGSLKNAVSKSKYNTQFTYHQRTRFRAIKSADISINLDTIIGNKRLVSFSISSERKLNKLAFITNKELQLHQFKINDVLVNNGKTYRIEKGTFLRYHLAHQDKEVTFSFWVNKAYVFDIILNEISYDLLEDLNFSISPRSEEMMPMPFVTNDAIIISRKLNL